MGTISTVAREDILSRLRKLPIQTVCLDEAQVPLKAKTSLSNFQVVHSDESVGWSGFLSYRCGVVIENVIYIIDYLNRQPLWNFMKAAFPRTRYCLSSATLTDAYVKDILSIKALPGLTHIFTFFITESLMISREDTMILFRPPTRPNIFLQVDV